MNKQAREVQSFRELQRGLTGERGLIGVSYMDDPEKLRAYLDYYWPVSFEQTRHALSVSSACAEMSSSLCKLHPFRIILDVGSGPGPVAAAFASVGAGELFLVDQSAKALELAVKEVPLRSGALDVHIATLAANISKPEPALIPVWGKADCVSFGHSLNELWAEQDDRIERRAALLETYSHALSERGCMLVIEPALLSTSRDLIAVRNLLVSRGWRVLAPCTGREASECPALEAGPSHTCHEELDWTMPPETARLAASMKLDKESLKMTWFLLMPPLLKSETTLPGDTSIFRVVSDPMLNKAGRIRRLLCGATGRFPLSVLETSPDAKRSGFSALKRGDFVRVMNAEQRDNGWGVTAGTVIQKVQLP